MYLNAPINKSDKSVGNLEPQHEMYLNLNELTDSTGRYFLNLNMRCI